MPLRELRLKWYDGNRIDLLCNGREYFPALCDAIDQAQRSVHLETYIFNIDRSGEMVLQALQRACERGVKVRVVIDGFGSNDCGNDVCDRLARMGAQHRIYRPEPIGLGHVRFNLRRLRRLHRKVVVIDGRIAFVGGINILDDYVDIPDDGKEAHPRFDYAVQMEGPLVDEVARAQRGLWLRMAWRRRDDWAAFYKRVLSWSDWRRRRSTYTQPVYEDGRRAALLLRDNVRYRQTVELVYLATIANATRDILIANAYFFPGIRLRHALAQAARRGVRVRLLLQGRTEYPAQYRACRHMYCKMLAEGIEIYEYMASYLHAKVAVIDRCAMVGSSNLDPFSLLLAREANVYVQDQAFAGELKHSLEREMDRHAKRVTEADLQTRGWWGQWADAFSYFLLRAGVAITGRSSEY